MVKDDSDQQFLRFPEENPNPVLRISKDGKVLYSNKPAQMFLDKWSLDAGRTLSKKWQDLTGNNQIKIIYASKVYKHVLSHQNIYAKFYLLKKQKNYIVNKKLYMVKISDLNSFAFPVLITNFIKEMKQLNYF